MKTLNYVKILLLCVFTIGLASCGDDVYYTMQNSDDKLCGKTWIEEYQTENKDGVEVLCSHQLKFAKADNSGQEIWAPMNTACLTPSLARSTFFAPRFCPTNVVAACPILWAGRISLWRG